MQRKTIGLWMMAGVISLVVAGCAKPPVEEQKAAESAKNAAITAQAETYAAMTMGEAKKDWDNAESKMQQKAYKEAKEAYVAAKGAFDKAAGEVEAGKKVVMDENKAALTSLEQSWKDLGKLAAKKMKKLKADVKNGWEADSKIVQEALKKAKENANPAEIKNALAEAKSLVEKWMESFKK